MSTRESLIWIVAGAIGVVLLSVLLPLAFPFLPTEGSVTPSVAREIALVKFQTLGEIPENPYVVVVERQNHMVEMELLEALDTTPHAQLVESPWLRDVGTWEVRLFARDAPPSEWSYRAEISQDGRVLALRSSLPPDAEGEAIDPGEARHRADELLRSSGFDLEELQEPETRTTQLTTRSDLVLRYAASEHLLGDDVSYGVQVSFQGQTLAGFEPWFDHPEERAWTRLLQQFFYLGVLRLSFLFFLLLIALVPFVVKYHRGEIGMARGTQILVVTLVCGILAVLFSAANISQGTSIGVLPRQQVSWVVALLAIAFLVVPTALLGAVSWSLGESFARERLGQKLAAFDALVKGQWQNATVARSSLRGTVVGILSVAVLLGSSVILKGFGAWNLSSSLTGASTGTWIGGIQVLWAVGTALPLLLAGSFLLPAVLEQRLSLPRAGTLAALLAWTVIFPAIIPLPLLKGFPVWFLGAAIPVAVFVAGDLLSALLAGLAGPLVLSALPLLLAENPWLQLQGCLPLLMVATPLIGSIRFLGSGKEFEYRYDDVPPHVRRIAERERQRVELETAREIQSSILPQLPPSLNGVDVAHAYLPATEVGGDFYDVLALKDGRLAIAVGDVAGHGVSSGLIMSMVKSTLALQVTVDPDVKKVMSTLNRTVYQSARRHLMTTLSYALLDPDARDLVYASAGHIFPYRVSSEGLVKELHAGSYPLGIRPDIDPPILREPLSDGDYVVLISDGLVEARAESREELFGFQRVADTLARHAGGTARELCQGILADHEVFAGRRPRDDDLTLLVLRLPT